MTPDEFMCSIIAGIVAEQLFYWWRKFLTRVHFVGLRRVFRSVVGAFASLVPSQEMKRLRVAASACVIIMVSAIFLFQGTELASDEMVAERQKHSVDRPITDVDFDAPVHIKSLAPGNAPPGVRLIPKPC